MSAMSSGLFVDANSAVITLLERMTCALSEGGAAAPPPTKKSPVTKPEQV